MKGIKIAVDAMGGDHAPGAIVEGTVNYLKDDEDVCLVLVGKKRVIKRELKKNNVVNLDRIKVIAATEEISMREHFLSYWRKREQTSIKMALDLIKKNEAQAMVSAGNTGAIMAIAKNTLGTIKNIDRPALALMIPTLKGNSLIVDVGANVDPKPRNLVQFALMGKVYLENVQGVKDPKIALMSVGEEETKGNELTRTTYNILKSLDINFIGNIEGRDAYIGEADLIVTDGFTGNVILKVAEGVINVTASMLKREIMSNLLSKIGFFFLRSSFRRLMKKFDYTEYGGALLLGVNGIVVIGHGNSNAKAIKNAIDLSKKFITENILDKISNEIGKYKKTFKELSHV